MRQVDELRPLTAGELLALGQRTALEDWPPEERPLRRNAEVLAACCYRDGERAYAGGGDVLEELTAGEMEGLLAALAAGERAAALPETACRENPGFDDRRFARLRGACGWTT